MYILDFHIVFESLQFLLNLLIQYLSDTQLKKVQLVQETELNMQNLNTEGLKEKMRNRPRFMRCYLHNMENLISTLG